MAAAARTGVLAHAVRAAFLAVAVVTVWREVSILQWDQLPSLLHGYRWTQFALAIGLTAVSFLLLGTLELLAIRTALAGTAWHVSPGQAFRSGFMAHALSQSAGVSILTGTAVRLAAYGRQGVTAMAVARVTALVTVGIVAGLLALGSGALLLGPAIPLGGLNVPARPLGAAMASIVLCYFGWSAMSGNPPLAVAAAQVGLSSLDFYVTASVLFVLLPPSAAFAYLPFIRACVLAHTLGMLSLVPGGVGVFEATMFALLAADLGGLGRGALTTALLAYRVVYYLLPFGAATVLLLAGGRRSVPRCSFPPEGGSHRVRDVIPGGSPDSAAIEWLIDNERAYDRILEAIAGARRSIWISQLAFDADCVAYGRDGSRRSIAEALLAAAARGAIDTRIVLNETFLLDTARPLRRFFAGRLAGLPPGGGTIEVRGVTSFPRLQHTKMLIVDGTAAFLLGSPFVNGYWDDTAHQPDDARRPLRELGGRPLHDLSIGVTGAPVAALERLFTELWTPDAVLEPPPPARSAVRVVSTSPRGVLRNRPEGATEILESLLAGIAAARSSIYIEHQYLSSRPLVAGLAAALRREPGLEIVMVLNENADVTAYRRWQNARLEESGLIGHPRVGVFALWTAARGPRTTALNQVFVHSKLVAVDDEWATAGSANLDGVSLHSYGDDFTGVGRRVFRHTRNFDVNLVVDGAAARDLRSRLWSEHLGRPRESLLDRPAGGWLPLWRQQAAMNVAALKDAAAGGTAVMRGFVLPYSAAATPAGQLADLGLPAGATHLDVRFNPGWLEVNFSPNWVRNMFA